MKFIIKPKKILSIGSVCEGRCSSNCFAKCGSLGTCFCPLK